MPTVEKALKNLQQANYAGYFKEMDNITIPENLKTTYEAFKNRFLQEQSKPFEFEQQLKVFAQKVGKKIADRKKETSTSDYDAFIQSFDHNHQTETSLPLKGKTVESLKSKTLTELFAQERTQEHFVIHDVAEDLDTNAKLKALNLMTNGFVLKGTFLCLTSVDKIRSVSLYAHTSKFFSFEDREGMRTGIAEFVHGNMVEQFQQIIRHLKKNLYLLRDIDTRTSDYQIPEKVFTELLANAFIHRNYDSSLQMNIKVELYPDRLVIYNPGRFPKKILKNLEEGIVENIDEKIEEPYIRNPEIAQVFYLFEWVETAGQGIKRSQELLKAKNMQPAVFKQNDNSVKVTVYIERQTPVEEKIKEAYRFLDKEDIVGFVNWAEEEDFIKKNNDLKKLYEKIKQDILSGIGTSHTDYIMRLKLLVSLLKQDVAEEIKSESNTNNEIDNIYELLENGNLEKAIKVFSTTITRKHKLYTSLIVIKTRYLRYNEKDIKGIKVEGELEKITNDFVHLLQQYEGV